MLKKVIISFIAIKNNVLERATCAMLHKKSDDNSLVQGWCNEKHRVNNTNVGFCRIFSVHSTTRKT